MAVPTRVRRGTTGSEYFYWDGVGPMTELAGGFGTILNQDFGIGLVTLSTSAFDTMQNELVIRQRALVATGFIEYEDYLTAVADAVNGP